MHQDRCCSLLDTWGVIFVIVLQRDPLWTQKIVFGADLVNAGHLSQWLTTAVERPTKLEVGAVWMDAV